MATIPLSSLPYGAPSLLGTGILVRRIDPADATHTKYIEGYINPTDVALPADVAAEASARSAAVTAEAAARTTADTNLSNAVTTAYAAAITNAINTEITNRTTAITNAVNQEVVNRNSAISTAIAAVPGAATPTLVFDQTISNSATVVDITKNAIYISGSSPITTSIANPTVARNRMHLVYGGTSTATISGQFNGAATTLNFIPGSSYELLADLSTSCWRLLSFDPGLLPNNAPSWTPTVTSVIPIYLADGTYQSMSMQQLFGPPGVTVDGSTIPGSTGTPYVMQPLNFVIDVNKTSGAATALTLPSAPVLWKHYTIIDGKRDANTNNITITAPSGTINGSGTAVINTAGGTAKLMAVSATVWRVA